MRKLDSATIEWLITLVVVALAILAILHHYYFEI